MKIYYNEEQFPGAADKCYSNPRRNLNRPIEYISSDHNLVLVEDDSDLDDFATFWDELGVYVSYLTMTISDSFGDNYRAFLEETFDDQYEERIFLMIFKVEGVEDLQ